MGVRLFVRESRIGPDRYSVEIDKQKELELALKLVEQHCRPIARLACRRLSITPDEFQIIGRLAELKQLDLYGVAIGESGKEISRLTRLESLNIAGDENGDEQLEQFATLRNLTSLAVGHQTTDAGLDHVKGMSRLQTLFLGDSQVNGEGLRYVPKQLLTLYLDRTSFGDEDAKQLSGFFKLQRLGLSGTTITDTGLTGLESLDELDYLSIEDTQIGDDSIDWLGDLLKLYVIDVAGSQITPEGIKQLQAKRPDMIIGSDGG